MEKEKGRKKKTPYPFPFSHVDQGWEEEGATSAPSRPSEPLAKGQEAPALAKEGGEEEQSLAKGTGQAQSLEKGDGDASTALGKGQEESTLGKGAVPVKAAPSPPPCKRWKVMVDWHNTLKAGPDDTIRAQDLEALHQLLEKGIGVYLCSWCGRTQRQKVQHEMESLLGPMVVQELMWVGTTTARTGPRGKADLATGFGRSAIFDDGDDILWECNDWGIKCFGITTHKQPHEWMPEHRRFRTFAEAVLSFMEEFKPQKWPADA